VIESRRGLDGGKGGGRDIASDAGHGGRGRESGDAGRDPDFGGKTSARRGSYTSGRNSEGVVKGRNP
jgi:hypothetical protein